MDARRLHSIPLFEGLSKHDLERVGRWADEIDVPAGKRLLDQGRFAYEFIVIEGGTVEVRRDDRVIATLGAGDFLGEIGLLGDDRRTATIQTLTPVRAIVMDGRDFGSMIATMPTVAARVREAGERRLASG